MFTRINKYLRKIDIMVKIGSTWYNLERIKFISADSMPIFVMDEDGNEYEFDMADIDKFEDAPGMDAMIMFGNSPLFGLA